jgi:hypothetical protein
MAKTGLNFAAQVTAWVRKTERRMTAVFRESSQRVISRMQVPVGAGGNMPIDTGFLRASIRVSLSAMPRIDPAARPDAGAQYTSGNETVLVISKATIGQTIYAGYTASYAGYQENKRGFVRLAALEWPRIVKEVSREAKSRSGSA